MVGSSAMSKAIMLLQLSMHASWAFIFHSASGTQGRRSFLGRVHSTIQESSMQDSATPEWSLSSEAVHEAEWIAFQELYELSGVEPKDSIRLEESEDGVRGLCLNQSVSAGDIIMSIPLEMCVRDDMLESGDNDEPILTDDEDEAEIPSSAWASRLARALVHTQSQPTPQQSLWFSMLPDPVQLRWSLPVHWPEEIVESTKHTAFSMAVDTAYFARADLAAPDDKQLQAALDVVQTRVCRVQYNDRPLRLLAPVFDFMNHNAKPSATFALEDDRLVVRAVNDMSVGEAVTIDYFGDGTASPAWKCLVSYGFVPDSDDDSAAEVYLDGVRYEVGTTSIPGEMVAAATALSSNQPFDDFDEEPQLTPAAALLLARRISDVAYQFVLTSPPPEDLLESPFALWSAQLASSLRYHQHRVLLKCSLNLRDWAMENSP